MELSQREWEVLSDRDFFTAKRQVTEKLDALLADCQQAWCDEVGQWRLPDLPVDRTRGKIFRGENYKGFPYTLMDFPRYFHGEDVFALRTMCWWGHEFSMTLHLQGEGLHYVRQDLADRLATMAGRATYFGVNATPWQYDFDESNYRLLNPDRMVEAVSACEKNEFLKLSRRWELGLHAELKGQGLQMIKDLTSFLD